MVAAFDFCLHGKGGAAPSIDTAMHGLVDAAHVDHLHPDSGIAIATAADGEALTKAVLRRPSRLGALAPARLPARAGHRRDQVGATRGRRRHPRRPRHHGLGRHLATSARRNSLWIIETAEALHRRARAARAVRAVARRLRSAARGGAPGQGRRTAPRDPRPSPRTDRPMVGHFTDSERRARLPRPREAPAPGRAGTSCPDHFLRTKVKPLVLDLPPTAPVEESIARLRELHAAVPRRTTSAYYERHADAGQPGRCAAPTRRSCSCPASGCSPSARTSRRPGSPASSTSTPSTSCAAPRRSRPTRRSTESEKFRIEYWALEEAKLAADAEAEAAGRPGSRS